MSPLPNWDDPHDAWPDPIPLGTADGDPPPFPVGCLPTWVQAHVLSVADEQQVAVDLPAMLSIVALAIPNAKRYRIHVQGDWFEPVNIYVVVALPPSAGKSPVFRRMFKVYERHEATLAATATVEADMVAQRRRIIEARMHKAEKSDDAVEAQIALDELRATPEVTIPRLIADDTTVEKLVDLLAANGSRMALLSDEGGLFDAMAGRYSDKANLDPFLQAWSGSTIRTDRIGRATPVVYDPLLTIGLTVQPAVIRALSAKPEFRGRGLTARFMYAIPRDFVGHRDFLTVRDGDRNAAEAYEKRIQAMLDEPTPTEPVTLELAPDAWVAFSRWRQGLEARRVRDGDLRQMAEWTTKLESSVCRLAALLHIAERRTGDVDAETLGRALTVGEYWLEHAKAVHDLWGTDDTTAAAQTILDWLAATRRGEFTVRDVYSERRGAFPNAASTVDPLNLLIEKGWLRPLFDGPLTVGRRGIDSPKLQAHPRLAVDYTTNCNNHARHADHARNTDHISISLSSSSSEGFRTRNPTHDAHDAQLAPLSGVSTYDDLELFP